MAVQTKKYKDGDIIIIRYEGPRGGPGMREMLSTTGAIYGQGKEKKLHLLLTEGFQEPQEALRWTCWTRSSFRRTNSLIKNGDNNIDAKKGTINVRLTKAQLNSRKKKWKSKNQHLAQALYGNTLKQ